MEGICHIVGAGDFSPHLLTKNEGDLIIAADRGLILLQEAGITPDLYIGDGDSLGFTPKEISALVLPCVKDDTDSLAALREGLRRGFRRFLLYGALGGKRFSHSVANLQCLSFLKKEGAEGKILDEHITVSYLAEGRYETDLAGGYFSLFPLEGKAVVSVSGAKYPLDKATLSPDFPIGVSNEGSAEACIEVHQGSVYLIREI